MAAAKGGVVQIPWYATLFRGDRFEVALAEIAPVALRYGATEYSVHRSRDDAYKFLQTATFENPSDWDRYWQGPEFIAWRGDYSSWYQVPVVYNWADLIVSGKLGGEQEITVGALAQNGG
jgi:hypothetical protein